MARHKFTLLEQLKAAESALRNPRTPPQLLEGLQRRAKELRRKIAGQHRGGLMGVFRSGRETR
jgi:hypothetical protein